MRTEQPSRGMGGGPKKKYPLSTIFSLPLPQGTTNTYRKCVWPWLPVALAACPYLPTIYSVVHLLSPVLDWCTALRCTALYRSYRTVHDCILALFAITYLSCLSARLLARLSVFYQSGHFDPIGTPTSERPFSLPAPSLVDHCPAHPIPPYRANFLLRSTPKTTTPAHLPTLATETCPASSKTTRRALVRIGSLPSVTSLRSTPARPLLLFPACQNPTHSTQLNRTDNECIRTTPRPSLSPEPVLHPPQLQPRPLRPIASSARRQSVWATVFGIFVPPPEPSERKSPSPHRTSTPPTRHHVVGTPGRALAAACPVSAGHHRRPRPDGTREC